MQRGRDLAEGRLMLLRLVVLVVAVTLAGRLWQLQMVQGETYRVLADRNRFRQVDVAAPRGVIYDRNGAILARNRPSFTVAVVPADLPKDYQGEPDAAAESAVLDHLSDLLNRPAPAVQPSPTPTGAPRELQRLASPTPAPTPIPDRQPWLRPRDEIEQGIEDGRLGGAYRPVTVATNIQEATAFLIAEDAANLPGVELLLDPIRDYPSGALTAHLIGYMGHIPQNEVADYEAQGYGPDAQVGLTGLEVSFEQELRGDPGRQTIEVDVNGRKVRTVGEADPAQPGHNLVLTVDSELQRVAAAALQEALDQSKGFTKATQGAVVALDPRNGAVLAMVSLPSHDNNLFAKGITSDAWNALATDPNLPLFNQAVAGQYPPGSIFKIIVASAGLQDGVINIRTQLGDGFDGVNDGIIWLPNEYLPWDRTRDQPFYSWIHKYGQGHGFVTVRMALAVSDDIFFYQLGGGYLNIFHGLGVEEIGYYARDFGLDALTGIELFSESAGHIPDPKWKRLNYAQNWLTGDTYNMSIGQGYVLATPLQMANATAAVANRGYLYKPQLVDHITDAEGKVSRPFTPALIREVSVDPANLDTVREGMYGAVNWAEGTAPLARLANIAVAGKTGTAEFYRDWDKDSLPDRDEKGNLPTHAWFTSFAPYVDPEIVVTVFIANGGEGSSVAAPVAAKVLKAYFGVEQ
ncbi:MAG: penicillin-binding protein 2 [Chloroflexi bacterium]|nr:penicillin-binding protein 2 [Chloroflexota bacterium]